MSDTPKFTVVDRRKFRGDEESSATTEQESSSTKQTGPVTSSGATQLTGAEEPSKAGPRLTLVEPATRDGEDRGSGKAGVAEAVLEARDGAGSGKEPAVPANLVGIEDDLEEGADDRDMPLAPSIEESRFQKVAYDQAAERLEDLVRAQNPGAPPAEKIGFEHLVQQLYLSAMMQMGAGTPEGQRPRVDILGARQTIDLLGVVADKTQGKLSVHEIRTLDTVLYELRLTFLELTRMVTQPQVPPPPGPKR